MSHCVVETCIKIPLCTAKHKALIFNSLFRIYVLTDSVYGKSAVIGSVCDNAVGLTSILDRGQHSRLFFCYFANESLKLCMQSLQSSSVYSPVNTHYKKNICQWQVARKTQEFNWLATYIKETKENVILEKRTKHVFNALNA